MEAFYRDRFCQLFQCYIDKEKCKYFANSLWHFYSSDKGALQTQIPDKLSVEDASEICGKCWMNNLITDLSQDEGYKEFLKNNTPDMSGQISFMQPFSDHYRNNHSELETETMLCLMYIIEDEVKDLGFIESNESIFMIRDVSRLWRIRSGGLEGRMFHLGRKSFYGKSRILLRDYTVFIEDYLKAQEG